MTGTKTEKVKLHDDKSMYTGVYAQGGPTNVDTDKYRGLDQLLDRSDADVRGRKIDGGVVGGNVSYVGSKMSNLQIEETKASKPRSGSRGSSGSRGNSANKMKRNNSSQKTKKLSARGNAVAGSTDEALADDMQSVFLQFTQGAKEMDGKVFAKMSKDCNIVNK